MIHYEILFAIKRASTSISRWGSKVARAWQKDSPERRSDGAAAVSKGRFHWARAQAARISGTDALVGALMVIGFFERMHHSHIQPLWQDEVDLRLGAFFKSLSVHAVPFPAMLHGLFMGLVQSTSPDALRMPSILFGVASIPMCYALGSWAYNRWVGLCAATLLTFAPLAVFSTYQGRPYGLLQFASALAIYAFFRTERCWWRDFALYTGALCLTALSHLLGVQVVIALGLVTIIQFAHRPNFEWLWKIGVSTVIACGLGFYYVYGRDMHAAERSAIGSPFWGGPWHYSKLAVQVLTFGFPDWGPWPVLCQVGIWFFFLLALLPVFVVPKQNRLHPTVSLYITVAVPVIITYLVIGIKQTWLWWPRYIIHAMIPFLILVSVGLVGLVRRLPIVLAPVPLLFAAFFMLFYPWQYAAGGEGWDMTQIQRRVFDNRQYLAGVLIPDNSYSIAVDRIVDLYTAMRHDVLPVYTVVRGQVHPVIYSQARFHIGRMPRIGFRVLPVIRAGRYAVLQQDAHHPIGCVTIANVTQGRNVAAKNEWMSRRMGMLVCDVKTAVRKRPAIVAGPTDAVLPSIDDSGFVTLDD